MTFSDKNNAQSISQETRIENGFYVMRYKNEEVVKQQITRAVKQDFIQLHFCIKGATLFSFNDGNYTIPLAEENLLLLYNPVQQLPMNIEVDANSWLITVLISIKKFHSLFSTEANYISFLSEENKNQKYYKDGSISPSMAIALNQVMNYSLHPSLQELYFKGKCYESVSYTHLTLPTKA